MLRILHDLIGQAMFDDLPVEHHDSAIGKQANHAQVMAHHNHRDSQVTTQREDKIKHARLNRKVQTGGDLVQEQQRRTVGKRLGNLHALLHTARKRARWILFTTQGDVHAIKQLAAAIDHGGNVTDTGSDLLLGDIGKTREVHAQAQVRVLVNHAKNLIANKALLLAREVKAVAFAPIICSDTHIARRGLLVEIEALHERRLARTRLAHNAQNLTAMHLERDVAHRVHRAAYRTDVALELGMRVAAVVTADAKTLGQMANGQNRSLILKFMMNRSGKHRRAFTHRFRPPRDALRNNRYRSTAMPSCP